MNRFTKLVVEPTYQRQQKILDEIADELGVVAFRPDYHGSNGDKGTVLFYTKEAHEHNRAEDNRNVGGCVAYPDYKPYFWSFESTDVNGQLNFGFANHGNLDLRGLHKEETLRLSITDSMVRTLSKESENMFVYNSHGGDSELNDRSGQTIEILRRLGPAEADLFDVGNMYRVHFPDGFETDVFIDEIVDFEALKELGRLQTHARGESPFELGTTFTAKDKLGQVYDYQLVGRDTNPMQQDREFILKNLTMDCETRVERGWFDNRTITNVREKKPPLAKQVSAAIAEKSSGVNCINNEKVVSEPDR